MYGGEGRMRREDGMIGIESRKRGAIWAAFVGDALCLGTHWIYDLDERARLFPQPHGFEHPQPGHYHAARQPGQQTHYGDAALLLLETIAKQGRFDPAVFTERFRAVFSRYDGYIDHATRETLANLERGLDPPGADDAQMATVTRLAPLVVAHLEDPALLEHLERLTRVTQNRDDAVAYARAAAIVLRELLRGSEIEPALEAARRDALETAPYVAQAIEAARARREQDVRDATLHFGQACPLAQSFPATVHALLRHGDDLPRALIETLRAGGDNAGRAALLGAWLGAHLGVEAVPRAWTDRLAAHDRIAAALQRLVGTPSAA
ncbi:MAG: ADP-ribosylglycohydrolase family protein [Planctomycetota bacterium]|nr:MAG: ADP-ribosylglycohydrolase family protein [Planctomycetota bacterium]